MNKSVLSISLDTNIAHETYADAQKRHKEYAKAFDHYSVIVLSSICLRNQEERDMKKEYHIDNLHIYLTNCGFKYFAVIKAIIQAIKWHKQYKFDVITTQDPLATGLVGFLIKLILKIPLNIQFHEYYDLQKISLQNALIKYKLKFTNSVRVVNPEVGKQVKQLFPNIVVKHIPMMIDTDFFYKQIKTKNNISKFISVGRVIKSKNFELLLDSISQVNKNYPNIKLNIAGSGSNMKNVQVKCEKIGVNDHVKFSGKLLRQQLKRAYHEADAFMLASDHEGWGNVFIEAAAAGLPIISTNVGAISAIFKHGETARIVPVGDSQALVQEIKWVIDHPKQAYQMAAKAQKMIMEVYDKEKLKKDWIQILKETK